MSLVRRRITIGARCCCCLLLAGCSHTPDRIAPPKIDAAAAGKQAIELYDANHDGVISDKELDKCPAIKSAIKRYDTGGDGKVTANNITARIDKWLESKSGVMTVQVVVRLDGTPLDDATVTFEPEPFLGSGVPTATGKTDSNGVIVPKSEATSLPGLPPGLYKIRISKQSGGREIIPARYNTNTTLGAEVALDSDEIRPMLRLDLKNK
jgi:hypothetical protein